MPAFIDFESTSLVDLPLHGAQRYAESPTTEILCLGWAIDDGPLHCWFPEDDDFPAELGDYIQLGHPVIAHNAQFDRLIWEYILVNDYPGVPALPLEQWQCSKAMATAHGLPPGLAHVGQAMKLPIAKQKEGTRLIRDYSLNGRQPWQGDDKALMHKYCIYDVEVMRIAVKGLRSLTDREWAEYHHNERMNELGIPVDLAFARAALNYSEDVKRDVNKFLTLLTKGAVKTATERKRRDEWLYARITTEQKELLVVYKKGEKKYSFDQEARNRLALAEGLDPDVADFIELINDAGGSSITKYRAMVNTHVGGRVPNALVWHGASTGRWTSKGIQIHNFIRDAIKEPQPLIEAVLADEEIHAPAKTLSRLLRAAITHPDGITYGDWSAIEGRICPWLADDPDAEPVLDVFRNDEDLYVYTAEKMGMDDRQAGKVAALSMQFAGGKGALQRMAKAYGVVYSDEQAEHLKTLWRNANGWCVRFWWSLHAAARAAYSAPNTVHTAGRIKFQYDGGHWLWMMRPSGNLHAYYRPTIELVEYPWGDEGYELTALAGSVKPKSGQPWPRRTLTAGVLIENCIAEGTRTLTDRGWVPIEQVKQADLVFDGVDFVEHEGLIFKGQQQTLEVAGVSMTPDHKVLTKDGWKTAAEVTRGEERHSLYVEAPCLRSLPEHVRQVPVADTPVVAQLRRARNYGVSRVAHFRAVLGRYGQRLQSWLIPGQGEQRGGVLKGELPLGFCGSTGQQYSQIAVHRDAQGPDDGGTSSKGFWIEQHHAPLPTRPRLVGRGRAINSPGLNECAYLRTARHTEREDDQTRSSQSLRHIAKRAKSTASQGAAVNTGANNAAPDIKRVYDIKNCGKRHRFVVKGSDGAFVVHNCTQGSASDLLRHCVMEAGDMPIFASCHDELLATGDHREDMKVLMETLPGWAEGLPVKAEVKYAQRFGK